MNVLLASSAQFFVAMGVLTMIYAGGAIVVYMLFITPELYLAKWIVIGVRVYELWVGWGGSVLCRVLLMNVLLHSLICCPIFDLSGCFPLVRSGPVASADIIIGIEYVFVC